MSAYASRSPHYEFDGSFGPMLYAVPLFCAIADLAFAMVAMGKSGCRWHVRSVSFHVVSCVGIQKDWIVVLSAGDSGRPASLSHPTSWRNVPAVRVAVRDECRDDSDRPCIQITGPSPHRDYFRILQVHSIICLRHSHLTAFLWTIQL